MIYEVNINNDLQEENFEKDDDNMGAVIVLDQKGNDISEGCRVQLNLSKNGLLGLGTELIRLAHNFRDGKHAHIRRSITKDDACQTMGIFLTPKSSELIVVCNQYGKLDDYLE